ncbi:MAG: NAD(P)-dependent oxidoreductase [Nitrospirota bacterium]|nr:NAD(P)-dependent oxidoreductase [Nitrospirota bacterium]
MEIGFIGLGNMGLPMAKNLLSAGHRLIVFNRMKEKAAGFQDASVQIAESPGEVASMAKIVLTMLADDNALRSVVYERGLSQAPSFLETLPQGGVHVSMSTVSVSLAKELAAVHALRGQAFVSAPVFGRPDAAATKNLGVVVAGEGTLIETLRPVFEALGHTTFVVGQEPYLANLFKIGGNFLIMGAIEALSEAFALVKKNGGDPEAFLKVVNAALFHSPLYENYGGMVLHERFEPSGFRLELGLKDVKLALEASEGARVPLPLGGLVKDRFLMALAFGLGQKDWSALGLLPLIEAGIKKP